MPLKEVIGEKLFDSTADHRTAAMAGEEQLFEDTMPDGSGGVRHLQVAYIPHFMYGEGVEGFYAMIQDISERKKAEDQIKASLAEKEVLLREIHHLVKNNLQVISGMLWLQADADDDAHTVEVLQDSRRRVMLMAQIHESLHLQDNLNVINARDLLSTLVANTKASGGAVSEHLSFDIDVDDIALDVDQANAYGQIISELISNSMKHAFATGQPGKVEVSLRRGDAGVTELTVADDGGGLPKNIDLQQTKTLGLQLVRSLAVKLEGEIHIDRSGGTRIRINFPAEPS
jgi:two-component sensor histidine kinase